jgi:RNA polymerase sigma-70 factor (ECF subfamily)
MSMFVSKPNADDVLANLVPMRRYARALARDETAAEDLVHEALVRAYEKRSTFRLGGNLRSWLLSILHNTFIDGQRRQKAEERRVSETAESADSWLPASQENAIRLQQIKQAFLGLPPEQRSVLHLVAIEGMKYHEAAEALGISIGTLMSRLGRARAALRNFEEGRASGAGDPPPGSAECTDDRRLRFKVVGGKHD